MRTTPCRTFVSVAFGCALSVGTDALAGPDKPEIAPAPVSTGATGGDTPFLTTNSHWLRDPRSDCWAYYAFDTAGITAVAWSGACHDHQASGAGTLTVSRRAGQDVLTGTFESGRLEGEGDVLSAGGIHVHAEFRDGLPDGDGGTVVWPATSGGAANRDIRGQGAAVPGNAERYDGSLKRGEAWGYGTLTYPDGETIQGTFVNDSVAGIVTLRLANGTRLRGLFKAPRPDAARPPDPPVFSASSLKPDEEAVVGLHYHVQSDGTVDSVQIVYPSGIPDIDNTAMAAIQKWHLLPAMVDDSPVPFVLTQFYRVKVGVRTWKGDGHYEGVFVNSRFDGEGKVTWPGGDNYAGLFQSGLENGHGVYTCKDGWIYEGDFKSGSLSGHAVIRKPDGTRLEGELVSAHEDPTKPFPDVRYPSEAARNHRQGTAVVRYRVAADGTVRDAHVIYGTNTPSLDDEAVAEVFRSRLVPATLNGTPVELDAIREIKFVLR